VEQTLVEEGCRGVASSTEVTIGLGVFSDGLG
jgi:hypothetical protein